MNDLERIGKRSLMKIVKEHKASCRSPHCDVSLLIIRVWLERNGVKFNKNEERVFI